MLIGPAILIPAGNKLQELFKAALWEFQVYGIDVNKWVSLAGKGSHTILRTASFHLLLNWFAWFKFASSKGNDVTLSAILLYFFFGRSMSTDKCCNYEAHLWEHNAKQPLQHLRISRCLCLKAHKSHLCLCRFHTDLCVGDSPRTRHAASILVISDLRRSHDRNDARRLRSGDDISESWWLLLCGDCQQESGCWLKCWSRCVTSRNDWN